MKRTITLFIAAVILLCMPGAALAADDGQAVLEPDAVMSPMLAYIGYATSTLEISSSGYADMEALMECYSPVDKIRISEHLQRYVNGSWQDVAAWSQYYYSDMASWSRGYYVASGYQYRLMCYFYCYYDTTLLESVSRADYYTY